MKIIRTKEEYLAQLRRHLKKLPRDEADSAIEYYAEYFDDAGLENQEATIATLGSPREVAIQIMKERAFQNMQDSPPSAKNGATVVWLVILGILASPIALPVAALLAGVIILLLAFLFGAILMLYIGLFSIVIALGAVAVALLGFGILYIIASFSILLQHVATGLLLFGSGGFMAGVGILAALLTAWLAKWFWNMTRELVGRWIPRMVSAIFSRKRRAV